MKTCRLSAVNRTEESFTFGSVLIALVATSLLVTGCGSDDDGAGNDQEILDSRSTTGHPNFASPHAKPIALSPDGTRLYVANTPADTVDVIDTSLNRVITRVAVGIDPVGIAIRPDGSEVWVANHISDSVSVIDSDPISATYHRVVATVQSFDQPTRSTRFDEPVGIAFADDTKAYVALSAVNQIAIIDVASRSVIGRLEITAQDPRAITVRGNRLYVIPFESGNQTELAGCIGQANVDGDQCTFDALQHIVASNNILSLGYDADIVRNPLVPDRDLFVFDTDTDELIDVVSTIGTLLYDVTASSDGTVFIAQTEARNDANGRAGTLKHTLVDLDNRAFLNQIAVVDCSGIECSRSSAFELEPLPPVDPARGEALATPFGMQISSDDSILILTAAGSNKVFTVDAANGQVLGRADVGWTPRGIALRSTSDGAPESAWVLNAVANSVSVIDVSDPQDPTVKTTIPLEDPTDERVKLGRFAFNNANASSTGTFSCESCHPDGHTDQLLWVLGGPQCEIEGCTQIPVRSTMPVRGLRDTAPYHWDGVPGDPFGGINGQFPNTEVEPNCTDEISCIRHLLDGALASTMCDQTNCPSNDNGQAGLLSEAERDAMGIFLLTIPYPPGRERPFDDQITDLAHQGFDDFFVNEGLSTCGNFFCHQMPFWNGTNTTSGGLDAPTFRGIPDRWLHTPQGRPNVFAVLSLTSERTTPIPFDADKGFDELAMWTIGFGTEEFPSFNRFGGFGPFAVWQMFLEGNMGFSGAFGRQLTLHQAATAADQIESTEILLDALESAANDASILLLGEGVRIDGNRAAPVLLEFVDGAYLDSTGSVESRQELLAQAASGELILSLTGRVGPNVGFEHGQPGIWTGPDFDRQFKHLIPTLPENNPIQLFGRHVAPNSNVLIDGRRVEATVSCTQAGDTLPNCRDESIDIQLDQVPQSPGMHLLQVQTPGGLQSNEFPVFVGPLF